MYSSCTKSTIKNQNTQLTEKSVGITMRIFPDYPNEKSQYPITKKSVGITQFTKISYLELCLSYPGSTVDQLWSKLEDIAIITIILSPGCQQPFLTKMASDNRLSAAVFGPKWLVTTGCQQPLPLIYNLYLLLFDFKSL